MKHSFKKIASLHLCSEKNTFIQIECHICGIFILINFRINDAGTLKKQKNGLYIQMHIQRREKLQYQASFVCLECL